MNGNEHALNFFLDKSNNGTALLFTGAGFSYGSENIEGESPPDAKTLSHSLCRLANIEVDDDLYYSSEYCLKNRPKSELIEHLKRSYTVAEVSDPHKIIASKRWRRIYTTNYDHVFENASSVTKNLCESVDVTDRPSRNTNSNQCVHLNGSIERLNDESIDQEFKLTESSYITPETIQNSQWMTTLGVDFENCSAIFFVGYSMYDLDIKRILKSDPDLVTKTFFIVKPGESEKQKFMMSKYGIVLDIGIDRFAELVEDRISVDVSMQLNDLEVFRKIENLDTIKEPEDEEVIDLFLKGQVIEEQFFRSTQSTTNYLVNRLDTLKLAELINDGNNIVVSGEIASGKTVAIKQVASLIANMGRDVFFLENENSDPISDFEIIQHYSSSPVFVVDNVFRHQEIVANLYALYSNRATFLLAGRLNFIERPRLAFSALGLELIEQNFDLLCDRELHDLTNITNNIGFWGRDNSWNDHRKVRHLAVQCEGRMSSILIKYFDSDYAKEVFHKELKTIQNKRLKERNVIFFLLILGTLPYAPRKRLISDFLNEDYVYSNDFENSDLTKLIVVKNTYNNSFEIKSGVLALHILKRYFTQSEIVDQVIRLLIFSLRLKIMMVFIMTFSRNFVGSRLLTRF